MKKICITIAIALSMFLNIASAQTWDELFNQKKTQTKYLMEQVAALQVYIGHIQKTYRIAKDGLDFISKATKGEFDLHNDFFLSLKSINPEVTKYPKVHETIRLQASIERNQKACRQLLGELGTFSNKESAYTNTVFERIVKDGDQVLDELKQIISANKLEMKDDERISRINALHARMMDNFLISRQFGNSALQLAKARKAEKDALTNSRILNQIKS